MKSGTITATIERSQRRGSDSPGAPLRVVASTERAVESDGYILRASGWDLEQFQGATGYGPFCWGHNWSIPPIGRCHATIERGSPGGTPGGARSGDPRLVADVYIDEESPLGAQVARLYRDGGLHAVSVGYTVLSDEPAPPGSGARAVSTRQRLDDVSAVVVGADSGAQVIRSLGGSRPTHSVADGRWAWHLAGRVVSPTADARTRAAVTGRILALLDKARAGEPLPKLGAVNADVTEQMLLSISDKLDAAIRESDRRHSVSVIKDELRQLLAQAGR